MKWISWNGVAISAASPGRASCRWSRLAEQVTRCGYRGPWSLEIFNDGFRAFAGTAGDGQRWLSFRCCGWRSKTRRRPRRAMPICFHRRRCRSITGCEFIEFAASAAEAQHWGQHLCRRWVFQHEGSHRSKQVTLWRNGGARIVIDHQPHSWADHFYQRHGVSLRAWRCGSIAVRRLWPAPWAGVCHLAGAMPG